MMKRIIDAVLTTTITGDENWRLTLECGHQTQRLARGARHTQIKPPPLELPCLTCEKEKRHRERLNEHRNNHRTRINLHLNKKQLHQLTEAQRVSGKESIDALLEEAIAIYQALQLEALDDFTLVDVRNLKTHERRELFDYQVKEE